jgi:hypothetical protein
MEKIAALVFRFAGVFLILGLIPAVVVESTSMLYWSIRWGSRATTGSTFGFWQYLWPVLGIVVGIAMLVYSRPLGRLISRKL